MRKRGSSRKRKPEKRSKKSLPDGSRRNESAWRSSSVSSSNLNGRRSRKKLDGKWRRSGSGGRKKRRVPRKKPGSRRKTKNASASSYSRSNERRKRKRPGNT